MPLTLTYSQALSLAPDETSRKNAVSLIGSRRWLRLRQCSTAGQTVLWGEIQGSGTDPYRCQVALGGPSFACTCPSKKRPCKHSLAMLLLFASQPQQFESSDAPDWIAAWLARQAERGLQRAARAEARGSQQDTAEKERKASARVDARDQKIRAGLEELVIWMQDLLRQGIASAPSQPRSLWENASARLVDAQAPGLARMVRAMPGLAVSGEGWQERLLGQIARLYLAVEGYRRASSLPAETQVDLRGLIGIHTRQEELRDAPGVRDTWLVLGREIEEEAKLKTQRTWLWGITSQRPALILSFSAAGAALDGSLVPGTALRAELVFYPGSLPLRAMVRSREAASALSLEQLPGQAGLVEASAGFSAALARYPWLERYPVALSQVTPFHEKGTWMLADREGRCALLPRSFLHGWTLLAISGGGPIGIFGEWNGETLFPLSAWADGLLHIFRPNLE